MPSIADQVATIEHDLSEALAKIDALTAANEALAQQNKAVLAENAKLQDRIIDAQMLVNDTRAAADQLAQASLHLLRTSRRTLDGEVLTAQGEQRQEQNQPNPTPVSREEQVERISALAGVTAEGGILPPVTATGGGGSATGGATTGGGGSAATGGGGATQGDGGAGSNGDSGQPARPVFSIINAEDAARLDSLPPAVVPINEFAPPLPGGIGQALTIEHGPDDLPVFLKRDTPFDGRAQGVMA